MVCLGNMALALCLASALPESPKYLIQVGKFDHAKKSFDYIAKINGTKGIDWSKNRFLEEKEVTNHTSC